VHSQHAGLGGGPFGAGNVVDEAPDIVLLPAEDGHGGHYEKYAVAAAVIMLGPPPLAKHSTLSRRGLRECSVLLKVFPRSAATGLIETARTSSALPASSRPTRVSQSAPCHSSGVGAGGMGTASSTAAEPMAAVGAVAVTWPNAATSREHSASEQMATNSTSTLGRRRASNGVGPLLWVGRRAAEERLSYGGQLMSADGLLGVTTAKLPAKSRRLVVTGESGAAGETVTSGRKKVEALPWKAGGWPKAVSGSASGCGLCDTARADALRGGSSGAHSRRTRVLRSSERPSAGDDAAVIIMSSCNSPSCGQHCQCLDHAAPSLPTSCVTNPTGRTLPGGLPGAGGDPDVIVIDDIDGNDCAGSGSGEGPLPKDQVADAVDPRTAETVPYDVDQVAQRILERMQNLFVTGGGCVGKMRLLRAVLRHARRAQDGGCVGLAVVAPTGVSAANAAGVTLHAFLRQSAGCFDETLSEEADAQSLYKSMCKQIKERLANTSLLLVDEISMVSSRMFTLLSYGLQRAHKEINSHHDWKFVAFGDFYQLPPVKRFDEDVYDTTGTFAFMSPWWLKLFGSIAFVLKYVWRQEDRLFVKMLNELRVGVVTAELRSFLERRQQYYEANGQSLEGASLMETTHILPLRVSVDKHNQDCLSTLEAINGSEREVYTSVDVPMGSKLTNRSLKDQLDRGLMAPARLSLAVGARMASCVTFHQDEVGNGIIGAVVGF